MKAKHSHNGSVANLRKALDLATPEHIKRGSTWYADFRRDILHAAATVGLIAKDKATVSKLVGIAAAFSPQKNPSCNLCLLRQFVAWHWIKTEQPARPIVHCKAQDRKAFAILQGADPANVLCGPKESAFYHNIMGDPSYVTIDGHAYAAWLGRYITTDKIKVPKGGPNREACRLAYVTLADELGLLPSELQAILWLAWRDHHQSDKTKAMRAFGGSKLSNY